MDFKPKLTQPILQVPQKSSGISSELKSHEKIISVAASLFFHRFGDLFSAGVYFLSDNNHGDSFLMTIFCLYLSIIDPLEP